MSVDIEKLLRENIRRMVPYSTARDEFKGGKVDVFLDANENPYHTGFNRYPDPRQQKLKQKIAEIKAIKSSQIFLGNGSDEIIDLIIRTFCNPGRDNILIHPPTYGMYQVAAETNNNAVLKVHLKPGFQLDVDEIITLAQNHVKIIFICSPNNPTGNVFNPQDIEKILIRSGAIVVIDEAYMDFSDKTSWKEKLAEYPNLIVLQTLSKAWGMASVRVGIAFAGERVVQVLSNIKLPYNLNALSQEAALKALDGLEVFNRRVAEIKNQRQWLRSELEKMPVVQMVFPSEGNFLLCRFSNALEMYNHLLANGIIVRDRSSHVLCENCLRISIGTPDENRLLLNVLQNYT
jgi:histidinol-phosphate aminotransferase